MPETRSSRHRLLGAVLVLAALATAAASSSAAAARHCTNTVLTHKDSGKTLHLHQCDRVTIRLQQASDGGYSWRIVRHPDKSILQLLKNKTVTPKHQIGGYSKRVLVYRAVGKGSTSLKLVESRSFQRHSQISKFKLSVQVK